MHADKEREIEQVKDNPVYLLKAILFVVRSFRYHPFVSILLTMGLTALPGALMAFLSGLFFSTPLPATAPMAERMANWGASTVVKPIGATLVVSTEMAYQTQLANYKQTGKANQPATIQLDKATMVKLQNFSKNNGVFVNFKQTVTTSK